MEKNRKYFNDCLTKEEIESIPFVETISNLLLLDEKNYLEYPALRDKTTAHTYKEFLDSLAIKRAILKKNGFKKGDFVGLIMENSVLSAEWMLAIISFGTVLVEFPASTDEKRYNASVEKFEIKGIIAEEKYTYIDKKKVIFIEPNEQLDISEGIECTNVKKEDPAMILFTGGTTGDPKGTLLSHCSLTRGAHNGVFIPDGSFHQLWFSVLPFSHVFGFVRSILTPLYCGSEIYISSPYTMLRDMGIVKPTVGIMVPGLAEMVLRTADMMGARILGGRLNKILCGGAPIPRFVSEGFVKYNVRMITGYGMTETANTLSIGFNPLESNNSVGKVYPDQDIRFVNGEVQLRGDNLLTCYYKDEESTKAAFTEDGWFRTGDVGYLDENNFLHLTGRIKNIILLPNGENVYPEELEEFFKDYASVHECIAKEDKGEGGTPIIAIEILPVKELLEKNDEELNAIFSELVEKFNLSHPSYKKISKLIIRKVDFERTISMKIWRK